MKKQSIRISIPSPCHEDWGKMNATEKGAFCQSCRKEVIDFSRMSDGQVIEYLAGATKVCGTFRQDQVARQMTLYKPQQGYANWKIYMVAMLPLMSFTSGAAPDTHRTKGEPVRTEHVTMGIVAVPVTIDPAPDTITIAGRVLDAQRRPLADADVIVSDSTGLSQYESIMTDSMGQFSLHLNVKDHPGSHFRLSASHYLYSGAPIMIPGRNGKHYEIILNKSRPMIMGKVMIHH